MFSFGGTPPHVVEVLDLPSLGSLISSAPVRFDLIGSKGPIIYDPARSVRTNALADQGPNSYEFEQSRAIRQPLSIAETSKQVGWRFGGEVSGGNGDCLIATDLDLPLAGTLNTYILMVLRINEFVSGKRFFGTEVGSACREVYMVRTLGLDYIEMINGVVSANAVPCPPVGALFLLEVLFTNSIADRLRAGDGTPVSGTNSGNRDRDGFVIGRGSDTDGNGAFDLFPALCTDGELSMTDKGIIRAALLDRHPDILMGNFGVPP